MFDFATKDLNVIVDQYVKKLLSLLKYTQKWKLELWESTFYRNVKVKGGIMRENMGASN